MRHEQGRLDRRGEEREVRVGNGRRGMKKREEGEKVESGREGERRERCARSGEVKGEK